MMDIINNHWFWVLAACYWIFGAAVDAMPELQPNSTIVYSWLYRFLHQITGNAKSAFASAERLRVAVLESKLLKGSQ